MDPNNPTTAVSTEFLESIPYQFLEPCRTSLMALMTYRELCFEEKSRVFEEAKLIFRHLWWEAAETECLGDEIKKKPSLVQYSLLIRALHHLNIPFVLDYVWSPSRNPLVVEAMTEEYPDTIRQSMTIVYQEMSQETENLPPLETWLSGSALVFPGENDSRLHREK